MSYFENLNYTLSNEDTRVEQNLLHEGTRHVFAIAGSGARVLPLLAKHPAELDIVDMSREQLFLTELRIAAARALTHEEYLFFLGYRGGLCGGDPKGDDRVRLFNRLKLSDVTRRFWAEHADSWQPRGIILLGKWESHFQKLGHLFRNVLRMDTRPIFEAHSLDEQLQLFERHWKPRVFSAFLRMFANEFVFNRFLYKGHFSGAKGKRTESRPPWKFLEEEFTRLFTTTLVRKNYFLQVLFLGGIPYEEGLPVEAWPETLQRVKSASTKINYLQSNLVDVLQAKPYGFVSLSDTISYLPDEVAGQILQILPKTTPRGARMVIRSFLRAPGDFNLQGWRSLEDACNAAASIDGTGVYRFHIFENESGPEAARRVRHSGALVTPKFTTSHAVRTVRIGMPISKTAMR